MAKEAVVPSPALITKAEELIAEFGSAEQLLALGRAQLRLARLVLAGRPVVLMPEGWPSSVLVSVQMVAHMVNLSRTAKEAAEEMPPGSALRARLEAEVFAVRLMPPIDSAMVAVETMVTGVKAKPWEKV